MCSCCLRREEVAFLGRCSARVSYYVLQVSVVIESSRRIVRVCGGVDEDVSIKYSS